MRLTITSHAEKQIKKYPKALRIILGNRIRKLAVEQTTSLEKLEGYRNYYKARAGDYRIIFIRYVNEIEIVLVGHRKEIYKLLARI